MQRGGKGHRHVESECEHCALNQEGCITLKILKQGRNLIMQGYVTMKDNTKKSHQCIGNELSRTNDSTADNFLITYKHSDSSKASFGKCSPIHFPLLRSEDFWPIPNGINTVLQKKIVISSIISSPRMCISPCAVSSEQRLVWKH